MRRKPEYVRVIGIDPSYAKGITYCAVQIQKNPTRINEIKIKYECHGTVKGNSPMTSIELLKEVNVENKLKTFAVIEDCYLRSNASVLRKLAMVIGSIVNFMERNQVQHELVLNTHWERGLYKGVGFNEERKRQIKKAIIKEDFAASWDLTQIGVENLNDDEIDAFMLARHGALKLKQDYMLSQSG